MNLVFLDTVGLLARWDRRDQGHGDEKAAFAGLLKRRDFLATTSFVLLECGNAAARRPYRMAVASSMHRLGIRREFTNDLHFRAAGFETLF